MTFSNVPGCSYLFPLKFWIGTPVPLQVVLPKLHLCYSQIKPITINVMPLQRGMFKDLKPY